MAIQIVREFHGDYNSQIVQEIAEYLCSNWKMISMASPYKNCVIAVFEKVKESK